ncbi:membrane fusion protein, cobalt-zinc-cadmium efflux system [Algoriphagus locisalis]|uniref:Membrane fusion protein, cobalt-zinc-cadmium efflux system n=1 Tax=Algoriphagus locisalis TaxID=305507 RepID=A0A1I7DV16_9BACT|nr:efflux RND transporter periplasmic adaptor subunit [Algoriphagus locisalis]SFU15493.1 membrane fusion protein, cobalt-zinc-cadmium efflux system [Algoriphagus locisalis]
MKNIYIKTFLNATVLASSLLFVQCTSSGESDSDGVEVEAGTSSGPFITVSQKQFETMKMKWGSPKMEEFSEGLSVQGMVKVPVEGIQEISAFFGGYVSGLNKLEGEPVRKGEVLFYLENTDFIRLQQDYLEASSQLNYLKAEFERQETLFGEKIASQKNYLKAEADYQATKAKAESLKRQLALININADQLKPENIRSKVPVLSPIAGFVDGIHLVQGSFLSVGGKAMTVISKEHLHIELVVFEKDAGNIHKGQKVLVTIPDIPGKTLEAEVFVVGQSINNERQINVHAHLPDEKEDALLFPGMFLEAKLIQDPKEAWVVPVTSVVVSEGESYVLVQREKTEVGFKLEKIAVKTGLESDGMIELLPNEALDENTVILTYGGFNLLP